MDLQLLQTCIGLYLVLAVPAFFLVCVTLCIVKAGNEEIEEHSS
jgi:hypothetical protein